jgi:hypothetical protein
VERTEKVAKVMPMFDNKEWERLKAKEKVLKSAAEILRVREEDLPKTVDRFQREIKKMEGE